MSPYELQIKGLGVSAGPSRLLDNVNLLARSGRILGLFGESGSGKTTILHAAMGILPSTMWTTGSIMLNGHDITALPPERRSLLGMAIVLQDLGLFDDRTVRENLEYPLVQRRMPKTEIAERVRKILSEMRIYDLSERNSRSLSGGQRQRVALARALVYEPRVLLLDEPMRGLHRDLKLQLIAAIRSQFQPHQIMILVTHDLEDLELMADDIVKVENGKVSETRTSTILDEFDHSLVPHPTKPGTYLKARNVRIEDSCDAPGRRKTIVSLRHIKKLSRGKFACFVAFPNGESGLLFADSIGENNAASQVASFDIEETSNA